MWFSVKYYTDIYSLMSNNKYDVFTQQESD